MTAHGAGNHGNAVDGGGETIIDQALQEGEQLHEHHVDHITAEPPAETHNPADWLHRGVTLSIGTIFTAAAGYMLATGMDVRLLAIAGAAGVCELIAGSHGYIRDRRHHLARIITGGTLSILAPLVAWEQVNANVVTDNETHIQVAAQNALNACVPYSPTRTIALSWGNFELSMNHVTYKPGETISRTPTSRKTSFEPVAIFDDISVKNANVPTLGFHALKFWTPGFWSLTPDHLGGLTQPIRIAPITVPNCTEKGPVKAARAKTVPQPK